MNFLASNDYIEDGRVFQSFVIRQHIDKLELGAENKVLDVGCGSGEETKSIAGRVKSVTATDASGEMIAMAIETNSAPNVAYSKCDARALGDNPDWRESFDKVTCFHVLHWVPKEEQPQAVRSISACVKPGGQALFIFDNQDDTFIILLATSFLKSHRKWGAFFKDYKLPEQPWSLSVDETQKVFQASGWAEAQCEVFRHEMTLSEFQLKLFMKTNLGHTSLIPETALQDYLQDLWEWALDRYPDASQPGHAIVSSEFMVVHALK